jgi:mono/diheme cytochrome c family protein
MKKTILFTSCMLILSGVCVRAADGKETFNKACAKCHGADGKGGTAMGKKLGVKDLSDAKRQAELKDEVIFKAIKDGVKEGSKTVMKASSDLDDEQIRAVVAYVRKLKK